MTVKKISAERKLINEYPYIWAWGKMMGSYWYYIEQEIKQAIKDKAPKTAIYYNDSDRTWSTFEQIKNPEAKYIVQQYIDNL